MSNWAARARITSTDAGYQQAEKLTGVQQELEITGEHRGREEDRVDWEQGSRLGCNRDGAGVMK